MKRRIAWWIPGVSLAVLAAASGPEAFVPVPAVAAPYHARVRAVAETFGIDIGQWKGTDCQVPDAANVLLHPNVIISRNYRNAQTGQGMALLLVQCTQSRDMDGHYPPNCYPGAGWQLQSQTPATWTVGDLAIPGTEFNFSMASAGREDQITVRDFFLLPDGRLFPNLATFRRAAYGFSIRPYGAAQVQVVFQGEWVKEDRDACFQEFVTALRPLIDAIRTGIKP